MNRKHVIVYTFESLEDPLIKGLILNYLKEIQKTTNEYTFHVFTHEHEGYLLSSEKQNERRTELAGEFICWYPIKYLSGNFKLIKKTFNFVQTFFIALKLKFRYRPVAIVGFLAIAGGFSYILSRLLNLKLITYCYEPHSEYMADFNIWKRNGLKYRLLKRFESLQIKKSEHLVIPNDATKKFIEQIRTKENVTVCPISIDTNKMTFDATSRERIRKTLNINERQVLIYAGKFGGIYFSSDDVVRFFSGLFKVNKELFFYIITPNIEETKKSIAKFGLQKENYNLSHTVTYSELNQYLSAADMGIVALPSVPSQKFRTPVKTAMYLSCELPYLVTTGAGEDDIIAEKENVGVVIKDLNEDATNVCNKINELLNSDKSLLKRRCRKIAETTRSTEVATSVIKKILSDL